ncbi:toxin-antitoxin system YwqK family antitoxin [Nocardia sp. XZ_19_369]|uniref:toxin-antitoxin system YwqK family antitoxin n=1 Tax=Nocardia sp. XZ_19_369 TaxID=2769487 RepID=UPI00188FEE15|nr:hypothetical protein [Nocardia sp. XZ_19_369]
MRETLLIPSLNGDEMLRVNAEDLVEADYDDKCDFYYQGQPFTGEMIETNAAGETVGITAYRDGVPDGPEREWFPDGSPRLEGQSTNGDPVGEWREWHPNGQISRHQRFDSGGTSLWQKHWDENGNLIWDTEA